MYVNEPEVARHYYQVEVKVSDEQLYILLNSTYPLIVFASSVVSGDITFVDSEHLFSEFSQLYRVLHLSELNEPLVLKDTKGRKLL